MLQEYQSNKNYTLITWCLAPPETKTKGERGGPARLIAAGSLLSCLLYIFCINVTVVAMPLVIENRSVVRDNAIACWRQWRGENTNERCDFKVNVTRGETVTVDVRPPKNEHDGLFCFLGFQKWTIL